MHQIPKQWEQPKQHITHTIVPSKAIIRVICGVVIEYFCLSRQHFLWWISALSLWLHFMSVLIGHTLKQDRKYTTVLKSVSQGSWIWGRGTRKKQPLNLHEAKKPWLHPNGDASQVNMVLFPLALFIWVPATLLQEGRAGTIMLQLQTQRSRVIHLIP